MSDKTTLLLPTLFVTFGAIGHLIRLLWDISFSIGSFVLPGWTGAFFFIGLGLLAAWSFRALGGLSSAPPTTPSNP